MDTITVAEVAVDPAISGAFTDGATLIGLLAVAAVGVVMAGIGIRVGIKWLRQFLNRA